MAGMLPFVRMTQGLPSALRHSTRSGHGAQAPAVSLRARTAQARQPRKGRPAALAASPFPTRDARREKGEGAQAPQGDVRKEPVGLGNRRLQIDRSGPFFTVFLPHSGAMGLQIRQKLSSLGPIYTFGAPSPTGS